MRYPMTHRVLPAAVRRKAGLRAGGRFTSFPTIFGIQFDDTGAEEAFSVYDHPEVRIYRKTPAYSESAGAQLLRPDRPRKHDHDVAEAGQQGADRR